ncbi:hypothetical protein GCM10011609_57260 [Lentzea pudingi]|uniref:Uncharacterized protein n=1 Tax=Lentzea pudingi TaxID=1789439 RepID=A0ABQ2III0_9PSEU|nr:hypothetical protein [Lentzea pudingi]GGN10031.1 hypothetical protein GCM10011609_57260 [Lentzea pudingi]
MHVEVFRPQVVRWRYMWEDDLAKFLKKSKIHLSVDDLKVAAVHFGLDLSELVEVLRASYNALDFPADSETYIVGNAVLAWEVQRLKGVAACWPRPRREWKSAGNAGSWRTLERSQIGLELRGIRANLTPERATRIAVVRAERATARAQVYLKNNDRALAVQLSERAELWMEVVAQCSSS